MAQDLRSKLAASGTVIVPTRAGNACQTLPDELCLEVRAMGMLIVSRQ